MKYYASRDSEVAENYWTQRGGAMFFYLVSRGVKFNAYLSDTNAELIATYKMVRDNPKGVIELLQRYEYEYKKYPPYSKEQKACYKGC